MRAVRLLPAGLALLAGVLGCSRTLNYTAGVCDCNPPDVTSVLVPPPRGYSMISTAHGPIAPVPAPVPAIKVLPSINGDPHGNPVPPADAPVNGTPANKVPSVTVSPSGQQFPADSPRLEPVPANPASEAAPDVVPDAAPKGK